MDPLILAVIALVLAGIASITAGILTIRISELDRRTIDIGITLASMRHPAGRKLPPDPYTVEGNDG